MAHLNQAFHTASGALATSGMRHILDVTTPVPLQVEQDVKNAKQRRLSRPNNVEELRLKRQRRKKKLRAQKRRESGNTKQRHIQNKVQRKVENEMRDRICGCGVTTSQLRAKVKLYPRKWKEERSLRTETSNV